MKKKSYLSGVTLLGLGLYFLFQQYHFTLFEGFYTWPTLLIIVGLGFLVNGYFGKDYGSILPGVLLTGLGLHFQIANKFDAWPDLSGIMLLLIALGILLTYVKTGAQLFQGLIFLALATLLLFFDRLLFWANNQGHILSKISQFWPYIFLVLGAYFLFVKRAK